MDDPAEPDCLTCGACCAPAEDWPSYVHVSATDREFLPPAYRLHVLVDELATVRRADGIRCVALEGTLGERVRCVIHPHRPDACRAFERGSPPCHEARAEILGVPIPWSSEAGSR